jgi:hypothetical protein
MMGEGVFSASGVEGSDDVGRAGGLGAKVKFSLEYLFSK